MLFGPQKFSSHLHYEEPLIFAKLPAYEKTPHSVVQRFLDRIQFSTRW
jgi:hypothetical protein